MQNLGEPYSLIKQDHNLPGSVYKKIIITETHLKIQMQKASTIAK